MALMVCLFYADRISAESRPGRQHLQVPERCRLDGMAIGLVNDIDDFPFFRAEVLPRMERLGLRAAV